MTTAVSYVELNFVPLSRHAQEINIHEDQNMSGKLYSLQSLLESLLASRMLKHSAIWS